jgi:hypothetical protein
METKLSTPPFEKAPFDEALCGWPRETPVAANPPDQESRIRAILKVPSGPLPEVGARRLQLYYAYLAAHLQLPFEARYAGDEIRYRQAPTPLCPIALVDPDATPHAESSGLICRAVQGGQVLDVALVDLEVDARHPNCQLIEDYWYWFWNWRFDPKI